MATQVQYQLVGSDGANWTIGEGEKLSLGRSRQNIVQIADSAVSRQHATLLVARGRCWIRDENSTHGTFVNGQRVMGQQELRVGDQLRIGSAVFHLEQVAVRAREAPLPKRQRRLVTWGVISAVVIVAVIAIALSTGGGGLAGRDTITRRVSAASGEILELEGGGAVVVLPEALSEDASVTVRTLSSGEASVILGEQSALSAVYEVTTEASAIDGQIELQLPYDDTGLSFEEERAVSIFFEEDGRYTALASTVDVEANIVYARTTHLTPFWASINPFDNPRIVRVWSSPATLANAQPAKPIQNLIVSAEVKDNNLSTVQVRYSFCAFPELFVSEAYKFIEIAEHIHRAELILEAGLNSPPVHTDFVPESQKGGKGRCHPITEWVPMGEASSGTYQSTILLSRVNWGQWEELKMELDQIKVEIVAEYADEQRAKESMFVKVVHGPIASDIKDASPSEGEPVFSPHPDFTWQWVDATSVGAARFYLAKGAVLWRDQGRPRYVIKERSVDPFEQGMQWQAGDPDLELGLYCWGLEVSDNDVFGEQDDIRTDSFCFYVREEGEEKLDVVITPSRGEQGEIFQVSVSGLEPNSTAIVGLIRPGSTAEEVLHEELPADGRGEARFSIGGLSDMAPGIYTVYVVSVEGHRRGEATFELYGEPTEEPTVEPTEEPTVEPTEEPTLEPTEEPTEETTKLLPAPSFSAPLEGETIAWGDWGCETKPEDLRFFWEEVRPDKLWEDSTVQYILWCFVAHEGQWVGGGVLCEERYHNFCYVPVDEIRRLMSLHPADDTFTWRFKCGVVLVRKSSGKFKHISEKDFVKFYITDRPCVQKSG